MAEPADAQDLGSCRETCRGSNPLSRTRKKPYVGADGEEGLAPHEGKLRSDLKRALFGGDGE